MGFPPVLPVAVCTFFPGLLARLLSNVQAYTGSTHRPTYYASPQVRFGFAFCQVCCRNIHSLDVLDRLVLRSSATTTSADYSQLVVTTANGTSCETSRDKSRTFPRLPARFTPLSYVCLWDFTAYSQLIRQCRLIIGFLFVGSRFRYGFFSPVPHDAKLASRYRVRRQLRPLGLSPKLRDMPVIL